MDDDRIKKLTFTGSPSVGWMLKAKAGQKKVTLELGGNAGLIIHDDADIELARNALGDRGIFIRRADMYLNTEDLCPQKGIR